MVGAPFGWRRLAGHFGSRNILTYLIHYFLKMNCYLTEIEVWKCSRIVNQGGDLALSHLARSESKYEQQRVDNIRLPRSIGPNDRGK